MATTVLVVEDDLEINELLGEYLALENIQYLQATTGQGGIHIATTQHPDAIVLDLMLPDIDGFEVARTLSAKRATCDIPIIILSCMCQEGDREKGFGSGALFYMNKPFLPDDLLTTLRQALEWKESLKTRTPIGVVTMGGKGAAVIEGAKALNEMSADLFMRTDLSDAAVAQIREAVETLGQWARQWNVEHGGTAAHLRLDYRVIPAVNGMNGGGVPSVEWKMTEDEPGILTDAFFKPIPTSGTGALSNGVPGWGSGSLVTKPLAPIAPPAKWLQVLAKTGAARFEKDTKTHTVRFARGAGGGGNGSGNGTNGNHAGNGAAACAVPVVEIDGMRIPTRLRDEALAARRK